MNAEAGRLHVLTGVLSVMGMLRQPAPGLLLSLNVQFWETENSRRLDSSHRWGHRRDIPCLVDAATVRTVKTHRAWLISAIGFVNNSAASYQRQQNAALPCAA